jgi:thioredoxin 2
MEDSALPGGQDTVLLVDDQGTLCQKGASTMSDSSPARPAIVRCSSCGAANRVDLKRLEDRPKCARCHQPLQLDHPHKVTTADFDRTIRESSVPVVVDFYADWCGPCKMMAPTLDDFARRRAGEALVLKLDTEAEPALAQRFGIRGIPTLIAFRNGQEVRRHVGVADARTLEALTAM